MNAQSAYKLLSFVFAFVLFPFALRAQAAAPPHWAYEGEEGPDNWSKLAPAYEACSSGHTQSPIDIAHSRKTELPPLQFGYEAVPLSIVDNGHTVMVNYGPGSKLTVGDKTYALKQFHFHHPSEEHVNGKGYDLVAHLVHSDAEGHLAVVAVLFKQGTAPGPLLDTLWTNVSAEKGKVTEVSAVSINVKDLLPRNGGYYTFAGSLTTPPCTEGVTWYVLKTPVSVSKAQVDAFAKLYAHNNRPIQQAYQRSVLASK